MELTYLILLREKKGTFVSFYIDHFYLSHWINHKLFAQSRDILTWAKSEIEEHQAYKISKLLAQKTFFSHAFNRVITRAVSRADVVIHKVGGRISVRFKRFHIRPGSIVGIFILYQACQSAWIMGKKSKE
jgi:hypothetical protein